MRACVRACVRACTVFRITLRERTNTAAARHPSSSSRHEAMRRQQVRIKELLRVACTGQIRSAQSGRSLSPRRSRTTRLLSPARDLATGIIQLMCCAHLVLHCCWACFYRHDHHRHCCHPLDWAALHPNCCALCLGEAPLTSGTRQHGASVVFLCALA